MSKYNFFCTYCNTHSVIDTAHNIARFSNSFNLDNQYGKGLEIFTEIIVCPNPKCRKIHWETSLHPIEYSAGLGNYTVYEKVYFKKRLMPQSNGIVLPNYIPKPIVEDYNEACLIMGDSPKAAATLFRRGLQGMVRDFWNIHKKTLNEEINELQASISPDLFEAIDGIRKIGNIGAHMSQDIEKIIEIDENEVNVLKNLIELLVSEWYVKREDSNNRINKMKELKEKKEQEKK